MNEPVRMMPKGKGTNEGEKKRWRDERQRETTSLTLSARARCSWVEEMNLYIFRLPCLLLSSILTARINSTQLAYVSSYFCVSLLPRLASHVTWKMKAKINKQSTRYKSTPKTPTDPQIKHRLWEWMWMDGYVFQLEATINEGFIFFFISHSALCLRIPYMCVIINIYTDSGINASIQAR